MKNDWPTKLLKSIILLPPTIIFGFIGPRPVFSQTDLIPRLSTSSDADKAVYRAATLRNAPAYEIGDRNELEVVYRRYYHVSKLRDIEALRKVCTPDFSQTLSNGQPHIKLEEYIVWLRHLKSIDRVTYNISKMNFERRQCTAIVNDMWHYTTADSKKEIDMDTTIDTWIKLKDGWKLRHSVLTKWVEIVDGKLFDWYPKPGDLQNR